MLITHLMALREGFGSANDSVRGHHKSLSFAIERRGAPITEGLGIMGDKMQFNADKCGIICLGTNNQKEEQLLNELVRITLTRD